MKMVFRGLKIVGFFCGCCLRGDDGFATDQPLRVTPTFDRFGPWDGMMALWSCPRILWSIPRFGTTTTLTKITQMQPVWLNCAWKNWGSMPADEHKTILYVDSQNVAFSIVPKDQLKADDWDRFKSSLDTFRFQRSGQYQLTVKIEVPPGDTDVDPKSEYTRTINVQSDNKAHLRPYVPTTTQKWSDVIVVSSATEATSDSSVYAGETSLYQFWVDQHRRCTGVGE